MDYISNISTTSLKFELIGDNRYQIDSLSLRPIPGKKGILFQKLIDLGVLNEFGVLCSQFEQVQLPNFDIKEIQILYKELFMDREVALNETDSLPLSMGQSVGSFLSWVKRKAPFASIISRINEDFVPYLLFKLMENYPKKVFAKVGIYDVEPEDLSIDCYVPARMQLITEISGNHSSLGQLEEIVHAAIKCIKSQARYLNKNRQQEKIIKQIKNIPLSYIGLEEYDPLSQITGSYAFLNLKEKSVNSSTFNWMISKNYRQPAGFNCQQLHIQLINVFRSDDHINSNDFNRYTPSKISTLQAFFYRYFGFISGFCEEGWFSMLCLYVKGLTCMQEYEQRTELPLEQDLFKQTYDKLKNNYLELNDYLSYQLQNDTLSGQEEFLDPHFRFFLILNASFCLQGQIACEQIQYILEEQCKQLDYEKIKKEPLSLLIYELIVEEKIPSYLLCAFLQLASSFIYGANLSNDIYSASMGSANRERNVFLLKVKNLTLQLPCQIMDAFQTLYDCHLENKQVWRVVENKLTQVFLTLCFTPQVIVSFSQERFDEMGIDLYHTQKTAEVFADSHSPLISAIGLACGFFLRHKLPKQKHIELLFEDLSLMYAHVERREPLQFFISHIVGQCIINMKLQPQSSEISNEGLLSLNVTQISKEELQWSEMTARLVYNYIEDLEPLIGNLWVRFYAAAAHSGIKELKIYDLWHSHIVFYLAPFTDYLQSTIGAILFGLKKSADQQNLEADKYLLRFLNEWEKFGWIFEGSSKIDDAVSCLVVLIAHAAVHIKNHHYSYLLPTLSQIVHRVCERLDYTIKEWQNLEEKPDYSLKKYIKQKEEISELYIDVLFSTQKKVTAYKECQLVGFDILDVPVYFLGELISVFCKKTTLKELDQLFRQMDKKFTINESESGELIQEFCFIQDINYSSVLSFLYQNLTSQRTGCALRIWCQNPEGKLAARGELIEKKNSTIKTMTFFKQGLYFIKEAIGCNDGWFDTLITHALFHIVDGGALWKCDLPMQLEYVNLVCLHIIKIHDIELGILASPGLKVFMERLAMIDKKQAGQAFDDLLISLPKAIVSVSRFDNKLFEELAHIYWELNFSSGTIIAVNNHQNPVVLTLEFYNKKKQFIEIMLNSIDRENLNRAQMLWKMTYKYLGILQKELKLVANLEKILFQQVLWLKEFLTEVDELEIKTKNMLSIFKKK